MRTQKGYTAIEILGALIFLGTIALIIGIVIAAVHFISKIW